MRIILKTLLILMLAVSAQSAARAADGTLRIAVGAMPPQLGNPYATANTPSITVLSAMFEGLTRRTPLGELVPGLAVKWAAVDEKTWRFELRKGVMFSNGEPFTATAVAAAVNYLASPNANPIDNLKRELPALASANVIDDFTVDIITAAPEPLFPAHAVALVIPEPKAYAALGREGFMKAPVGTGPFMVENWEPAKITFKAFAGSWRTPRVARLEVIGLPDKAARVQAVMTGAADITIGLGPEDIAPIEAAGGKSLRWVDPIVQAIALVTTRDLPFNDVRVRQALNMAINRQLIIDVLLDGATVPANQPAARMTFGYNDDLPQYAYDPAAAKKLLLEAGYQRGFTFTLETAASTASAREVFQRVASDLSAVGVTMNIQLVQAPQFLRNVFQTGEYADAIAIPFSATPSLDGLRAIRNYSCFQPHAWYCDKTVMPFITAAMAERDEAKARSLRREIMAFYHREAPAIFLFEQASFAGLSARVRGYADAQGVVNYHEISLDE